MSWGGPGPRRTAARNASATLDADMAVCRLIMWGVPCNPVVCSRWIQWPGQLLPMPRDCWSCSDNRVVGPSGVRPPHDKCRMRTWEGHRRGRSRRGSRGSCKAERGEQGLWLGRPPRPSVQPSELSQPPRPQKQCSLVKVVHVQEPCPEVFEAREVPIQRVPFTSHCPSSCWCWASWVQPRAA